MRVVAGVLVSAITLLVHAASTGAPGDTDPSFGSNGIVTTDLGGGGVASIALQPDGKILAAGGRLARFNQDGSLDPGFGLDGTVTTGAFGAGSLALQPDGMIVAAGGADTSQTATSTVVVRYRSDGSPDTSFGSDGLVTTPMGADSYAADVSLQPDGKIVVAASSSDEAWPSPAYNRDFAVVRYNRDGSLDSSFGRAGIATTDIGSSIDLATAIALQPDGRIVVSGQVAIECCEQARFAFALARYTPDGSLDTSFGSGGLVITPLGTSAGAADVALQPDGKILAAGSSLDGTLGHSALVRYNPNGSLDAGFGSSGVVIGATGRIENIGAIALQADEKIVAAGSSGISPPPGDFAVARYNQEDRST